jgi:DNA primase
LKNSEYFEKVLSKLRTVTGPDKAGWYTALCPFHNDQHHPNLRFKESGFCCMACGEKGNLKKLAIKFGVNMDKEQKRKTIKEIYDYKDENGKLLFQVVRYEPKDFRQRRPDGKGGWIWNLDGIRRVLYCLPELIAAQPDSIVFIVEGEKDVKAIQSLGLVATCNSGGAGQFTAEMREPLKNRPVVIIADRDEPGRKHAQQVASILNEFAASVKVMELPDAN